MDDLASLEADLARIRALGEKGWTDETESTLLQALTRLEKGAPESPAFGGALQLLGELFVARGQHAQAEPLLRRALSLLGSADHGALGECCMGQERYREAAAHFREVVSSRPAPGAFERLADALSAQGLYDEAEPHLLRARALREEKGEDLVDSLARLGVLRHNQGRYAEAEALYRDVIARAEKALGPDHPDLAPHLNALGLLYRDQGRWDEAQPLLERARKLSEASEG